jgi:hypothetical protein
MSAAAGGKSTPQPAWHHVLLAANGGEFVFSVGSRLAVV